jgi:hypothetical protein
VDVAAAEAGSAGASSNDDDEGGGAGGSLYNSGEEPGVGVVVECGDGGRLLGAVIAADCTAAWHL